MVINNIVLFPFETSIIRQTPTHLMASFPGQPGQVGIRKLKPVWILMKQEIMGWQWHQPDHMQIICTLLHSCPHWSGWL